MKKMVFALLCVLASCNSNDEFFTCDNETNRWINDNLESIHLLSRSEWMELDDGIRSACISAFTKDQRLEFWKEKLQEVMLLKWSETEMEHLQNLLKFITQNPEIFDFKNPVSDEQYESSRLFFYEWSEYAKEQLGWTDKQLYAMVGTGDRMKNKDGDIDENVEVKMSTPLDEDAQKWNCNCALDAWVRWCLINDCEEVDWCEEKSRNCGFLLLDDCDGRCGSV